MKIEDVLLPKWRKWDGNGVSDLPARNTTFRTGQRGCIIISAEGISLYAIPRVSLLNTNEHYAEGKRFIEHFNDMTDIDRIHMWLPSKLINECSEIYRRYKRFNQ